MSWLRKKDADGHESCCCPDCGATVDESQTQCTVCGYDVVQQTKTDLGRPTGAGLA